jgi:ribose transport system permease protein
VNVIDYQNREERRSVGFWVQLAFVRAGVLPVLLVIAVVVFTVLSGKFVSAENLTNVVRQSTYLALVALGQMLVLLTGGFDLSVGSVIALTSVVGATVMASVAAALPDSQPLAILLGVAAAVGAGTTVGLVNGIGVALVGVSPFIMTLGVASIGFGIALFMTGGVPVYGMPAKFGDVVGFGNVIGIPTPVLVTLILILLSWGLMNRTRIGRYFYAVGGNVKAATLSGINARLVLFTAFVLSSFLASISGILLTARLGTGEANIGASMPLESITACVIGGVSLRGGIGRVENVILGALFIGLVQNGMNLAQTDSYLQTVVIGVLLILAVVADRIRVRLVANLQD